MSAAALATPRITRARLVPLGRHKVEVPADQARSWDIELTFVTCGPYRLKRDYRVRSLAVSELARLLSEARTFGLDARPRVRADLAPKHRLTVVAGGAK